MLKAKRVRTVPNLNKAGSSAAATVSTVGGFLWLLHAQGSLFSPWTGSGFLTPLHTLRSCCWGTKQDMGYKACI